ncbi:hypothetical protein SPSIL_011350 [Sporomusa silvacetica DSM 10669]|uniref:Uncharacterized protein n=1 Tax=Sporomusa silvacetica DSM 10669 TaxID=1123289 RepID=A0ABZ3IH85_9FIRM|nr:hypothetical protein SPSIL_44630 [Sporomusa silvacetica DSM 10669]
MDKKQLVPWLHERKNVYSLLAGLYKASPTMQLLEIIQDLLTTNLKIQFMPPASRHLLFRYLVSIYDTRLVYCDDRHLSLSILAIVLVLNDT